MRKNRIRRRVVHLAALSVVACASETGERATSVDEAKAISRAEAEMEDEQRRFNGMRQHLEAVQERFEPALFSHVGVTSIGIGLEEDRQTPVFRVVVHDPNLVDVLPRRIEGVRVSVAVARSAELMDGGPACGGGAGYPCHANQTPLPVEMGNSGAWLLGTACTLGFKACDINTGRSTIVTNSHCAQYASSCALASMGDPVKHVGPLDASPPGSNVTIGSVAGHSAPVCGAANNFVDATKVETTSAHSTWLVRDIGGPKHELLNPTPGWIVVYSGRTTGWNAGTIQAVNVTVNVPAAGGFCCGALKMKDQLSIKTHYGINGGDSGSGVLLFATAVPKKHLRVLGLLFASDGTYGYMNNVGRVLSELGLTLDRDRCLRR